MDDRPGGVAPASAPTRVLVVDDEPDTLETLAAYLRHRLDRVEVLMAASGPEAMEFAEDGVDILLTDYRMPVMDGVQLIEAMRERCPEVAAMMMTAYPDVDVAVDAVRRGRVVHFFSKPPDPNEITQTMTSLLKELRQGKARERAFDRLRQMALGKAEHASESGP